MDYLQGNAGNDTLDGGAGNDRINGGADNDAITADDGNDSVNGNAGNDTIDGGAGLDTLRGGQGDDQIVGGDGNDALSGDLGNDTLEGGHGADVLTGGGGADLFRFDAYASASSDSHGAPLQVDEITDFASGTDRVQLSFTPMALLTGTAASASEAITVAQGLMAGHSGSHEVALVQVGSDTYLVASGDGASDSADLAIRLDAVTNGMITTADFV